MSPPGPVPSGPVAADLGGRTILITGATSGIGLHAARALAARGARVVVGARDRERGSAACAGIAAAGGAADLLIVDVASMESVRRAAATAVRAWPAIDVLVNNAGIFARRRFLTAEGHESTWATNLLGPFLLTRLLLAALRRAPSPRVVNVSSDAHRAGRLAWDDLEGARRYRGVRAYAQSKLALVLFTRELARREPWLAANAVHPGAIATNIWRAAPIWLQRVLTALLPPAEKGAGPLVHLAASPELRGVSGRYFKRMREREPSAAARADSDAARLWEIAERATAAAAPPPGPAGPRAGTAGTR